MSSTDPNILRAQARVGSWLRGKWHLDRLIGVGGMAAVFAATHRNGKQGAVKLLHLEYSTDADARGRFLREGYVANKVGHPGAVSVLDDDVNEDGTVFLVMELLDGKTADALANAHPGCRLPLDEVLDIADGLLDVLAAAHGKNIVHRDLKPENIFVTSDRAVHILDFGIARLHEPSQEARGTRTGQAFGTPAFMPPEQALGEWNRVDARTDLWAVGATMFTLLTGKLVHEAESLQKLMLAAMTKPAPPLASVMPGMPNEVALVIDRALSFEPKDRWPNAAAMQQAVREARRVRPAITANPTVLSGGNGWQSSGQTTVAPVSSEPPTKRKTKSRGLAIATGAVLLLAAAGAAIWFGKLRGSGDAGADLAAGGSTAAPLVTTAQPTSLPEVIPSASALATTAAHPGTSAKPVSTGPAPSASATTKASAAPTVTSILRPTSSSTARPGLVTTANPYDRRQ